METTITTKDGKQVIITHEKPISDPEMDAMRKMTIRELFCVGSICGIRLED